MGCNLLLPWYFLHILDAWVRYYKVYLYMGYKNVPLSYTLWLIIIFFNGHSVSVFCPCSIKCGILNHCFFGILRLFFCLCNLPEFSVNPSKGEFLRFYGVNHS